MPHGPVCSILNRPERQLDNRREGKNGEAIVPKPTVEQVHEVEEKLAHQLEDCEVDHLRFITRKLRESMVKLRPGIDVNMGTVPLTGLLLKSWHPKRAFVRGCILLRRLFGIIAPAPS